MKSGLGRILGRKIMALHRDDVPFEHMEEIEKALKEQYPGFKVQCVGDANRTHDGNSL
jgi:hypothetical protein